MINMSKRVVEVQILGNEWSRARYEVNDNERVGDIVRRYLQEHDPSLLNSRCGYLIAISKPNDMLITVDSNIVIEDLVMNYGTNIIYVVPVSSW